MSYKVYEIHQTNKKIINYLEEYKTQNKNYPDSLTSENKIQEIDFKMGRRNFGEFEYTHPVDVPSVFWIYYPIDSTGGWLYYSGKEEWIYED